MKFSTPGQEKTRAEGGFMFDDALPWVLILGDSISMGYTPFVREYLAGKWNIDRPRANCGDTLAGLKNIDQWLGDRRWDVIHFNWGLHDLCHRHPDSREQGNRDKVKGRVSVPLEQYGQNLRTLVARMRQLSDRLIWADTTIVPPGEPGRFDGDELKYNAVARELMASEGIETNDLHTLTAGFAPSSFIGPGDVHFTDEGSRIIARQVADAIDGRRGKG
jgi:lysophospholipase L1-like esterase